MNRFRKNSDQDVVAVQIDLDTDGLHYRKWGDQQRAKSGDWLVNNNGATYTIDENVFARTYEQVSLGVYRKTAVIFAEQATEDGSVATLEGRTHYRAGDYLVYEDEAKATGAYAINRETFESSYVQIDE